MKKPKPNETPGDNPSATPSPATAPFDELEWAEKVFPNSKAVTVYREARAAVHNLMALADKGDKVAARFLWKLTHDATGWIGFSKSHGGDLVRSLAPEKLLWPVLASLHPQAMREVEEELNRLGVGGQANIRSDSKAKHSIHSLGMKEPFATTYAKLLVRNIEQIQARIRLHAYSQLEPWELKCKDLPRLTKKNVAHWWPIVKIMVMISTNDEPEKDQHLRRMVVPASWDTAGKAGGYHYPSQIRQRIFDRLHQALKSIAPPSGN